MKRIVLAQLALLTCILIITACGGGGSTTTQEGDENPVSEGVPEEYAGKTNPFAGDTAAAEAGNALYDTHCASCHGDKGKGDGPAAGSLNPAPSDLADEQSKLKDDMLFWRITEGGMMSPFNSVMPAWNTVLSEEQIWQIVTYLHTLK